MASPIVIKAAAQSDVPTSFTAWVSSFAEKGLAHHTKQLLWLQLRGRSASNVMAGIHPLLRNISFCNHSQVDPHVMTTILPTSFTKFLNCNWLVQDHCMHHNRTDTHSLSISEDDYDGCQAREKTGQYRDVCHSPWYFQPVVANGRVAAPSSRTLWQSHVSPIL